MNTISIIGNVVRDCEVRKTTTGRSVCSFTLAVNRMRTADGNQITDFIPCVAWEQLADTMGRYIRKGDKVGVVGMLQSRKTMYKGMEMNTYEVNALHVDFLTVKSRENEQRTQGYGGDNPYIRPQKPQEAPQQLNRGYDGEDIVQEEDLPF